MTSALRKIEAAFDPGTPPAWTSTGPAFATSCASRDPEINHPIATTTRPVSTWSPGVRRVRRPNRVTSSVARSGATAIATP